eukprot:1140710-Pelagomonas_calceolata.AAC.5
MDCEGAIWLTVLSMGSSPASEEILKLFCCPPAAPYPTLFITPCMECNLMMHACASAGKCLSTPASNVYEM